MTRIHPYHSPGHRVRWFGALLMTSAALLTGSGIAVAETTGAGPGGQLDASTAFDHDHVAWTLILSRFVRGGQVDYAGIQRKGQPDLAEYLSSLGAVRLVDYGSWTRAQKLAFWINAYNAATVRVVLDHYPVTSIRKIGSTPNAAFRLPVISVPAVGEKELSLNDIEHEILRKQFQEPRIHFALVCAAKSCPELRGEAYRASDLETQLDEAARGFARDGTKNRYDAGSRVLSLSSIFKWYREDFEKASGSLPGFFARFANPATANALKTDDVKVKFLDYDWSLNGRTP